MFPSRLFLCCLLGSASLVCGQTLCEFNNLYSRAECDDDGDLASVVYMSQHSVAATVIVNW